ncbi:chromate transporter [Paeniroseomonas aquatica]|uniref:chromate transporter n=1 Tax=Paeniroseomonas aquatica TaxID=373043 RepID=UPI003616830A
MPCLTQGIRCPRHPSPAAPQAGLGEILRVFTSLGMASFGGGLAGWMHREVVEKRRWLSEEGFLAGVALGQVLPGANSVNLALYIGQQLRGVPGAAAAFLGMLGPPFLFILGLALLYGWGWASPAWGWCWGRRRGGAGQLGLYRAADGAAPAGTRPLGGGGRDLRRDRAAAAADDPGGAGGGAGQHRPRLVAGDAACLTAS